VANLAINPDLLAISQVLNILGVDFVPPPHPQPMVAMPRPQANYVIGRALPDAGGHTCAAARATRAS
jgi:hypothetical protein